MDQTQSSKLSIILIGIFLILAAGAGGVLLGKYLYSPKIPAATEISTGILSVAPTIDPTADWKTYTNAKYFISFSYPSQYELREVNNSTAGQFSIPMTKKDGNTIIGRLVLDINKLSPNSSPNYLNLTPTSKKTINDIDWLLFTTEGSAQYCDGGECGGITSFYQTTRDSIRYVFLYDGNDTSDLNQILSTFKFLE